MSLKSFHIVFLAVCGLLFVALASGKWNEGSLLLLWTGRLGLVALIPYAIWFGRKFRQLSALLIGLTLPSGIGMREASACAVCFGDPASPMTQGMKAGIIFLTGVVGGVLFTIAVVAVTWYLRARKISQ